MAYELKPFYINLNDLAYLLQQVSFVPLFDGPGANASGIVAFDPLTMDAWDVDGNQVWSFASQTGSYNNTILNGGNVSELLGGGFPSVSAPIGIRDVSGLHNNLYGTRADWGSVDNDFRRDLDADFNNYVTEAGADYGHIGNVIDNMPRIISRTITTADVNLLKDGNNHYVGFNYAAYNDNGAFNTLIASLGTGVVYNGVGVAGLGDLVNAGGGKLLDGQDIYLSDGAGGVSGAAPGNVTWSNLLANSAAYKALVDSTGTDVSGYTDAADGLKLVLSGGNMLAWDPAMDSASMQYNTLLTLVATGGTGDKLYGANGVPLQDGMDIYYNAGSASSPVYISVGITYNANLAIYHSLVVASGANTSLLSVGDGISISDANVSAALANLLSSYGGTVAPAMAEALLVLDSGYGLLEQLGHIDFQQPNSGEFFVGSENPGVAPVNMWFAIFGQFFDHGLDLIGKGGNGKITINLALDDPLYGAIGPDGQPVTKITVTRAAISNQYIVDDNGANVSRAGVDGKWGTADDLSSLGADNLLGGSGQDADVLAPQTPNYINHTSPFIDQSQTYGSVEQITNLLREWVSTDGGTSFHAGMELFDGVTLVDAWERRLPDGTTEMVHKTLPTLNELRDHVLDTGRAALTWDDVIDYRNRNADGSLGTGNSGHALILDMNNRFDSAHLDSMAALGNSTVNAVVDAAVATLSAQAQTMGMSFGRSPSGGIQLIVTNGAGGPYIPDGVYTGFSALIAAGWVNPSTGAMTAASPAANAAVGELLMASVGDHYIAGDGRVNENFGLTSIHHVFHEEHNFQVENLKTWIYAHDAENSATTHEGLHAWQINTLSNGGSVDGQGNYLYADGSIAWDADKMFNATKLIVEMEYQHAAVDQYARTITPRIQEFVGYSSGVDSTISLEYAQVAFRFGHSTIRETIDTLDPDGWFFGTVTKYALEKAFLNPQAFADEGIAAITLGLSRAQMNEVDEFITPALNQGLLGQPLDLAAINIARGRDLGIPTLNLMREGLSLAKYVSWGDFGASMVHPESLVNFIAAYSFNGDVAKAKYILDVAGGATGVASPLGVSLTKAQANAWLNNYYSDGVAGTSALEAAQTGFDHIDAWIGGMAEAHVPGGILGETFDAVFVAQIQALMDGDRFYYLYRLFGTNIHEEVNNGQFKDIVERNTGLSHLNGSIFAYADKYYDFSRAATVQDPDHAYGAIANTQGVYSDGGADMVENGNPIDVLAADGGIRTSRTLTDLITDIRPELNPDQVHTVEGTPTSGADSHEVIVATNADDYIHGRAGDDTIYGEGGNDYLFADGGVDRTYGGAGDDLIDTGEGPDLADGGSGKDIIYGRGSGTEVGGFDQLVGGSGNDLIIGGEGIDKLSGGSGDDIIYGDGLTNPEMGNTDAFTHGGDGNDYIDTGASGDLLYGEEGDDYMVGGVDQDLMQGGTGDDILRPGDQSQAINGGPDEVIGDDGYTNTGFDLIDFSDYGVGSVGGVTVNFSTMNNPLPAIDGTRPFPAWFQMEGAIGSRNNDSFVGDSAGDATAVVSLGNNWLVGGSGNDSFVGAGGDDVIVGGSIRLDALVGHYDDAVIGNLALGSMAWLQDAMQSGGTGTGYDNNVESTYNGASNRSEGVLAGGLLSAAGMNIHFQDMLQSRMFKDVMLGDGGAAGNADVATFSGNVLDYDVSTVSYTDSRVGGTTYTGIKTIDTNIADGNDGADLMIGMDQLRFAGISTSVQENTTQVLDFAGLAALGATFTLSGADASAFQIAGGTNGGDLAFAIAPDAELPTDFGGNNVYNVTVSALLNGTTFVQNVAVTVANVNDVPLITSNGGGATAAITVAENTTAVTTVLAIDPDLPAQAISYSIVGGADASRFSINATTGVLSYANPAPNFEAPSDVGADNVYDVIVQATDSGNPALFDQQSISVTVTDVNETPSITSNGGLATAAISMAENTSAVTTVVASDPEAAPITYSIVGGLGDDAGMFAINAATGALTFVGAPDFEAPAHANNVYNVTVAASDGSLTDTQAIAVTVTNANDAGSGGITINSATRGPAANQVTLAAANTLADPDGISAVNYTWRNAANTAVGTGASFVATSGAAVQTLHLSATYVDAFGSNAVADALQTAVIGTTVGNTINGTAGADFMFGFAGNDTLMASAGNDTIDGGTGTDTYNLSGTAANATVSLSAGTSSSADTGSDTLIGIENVIGSNGVNTIYGTTGNNVLSGLGGNDSIYGGGGTDTLNGGLGADQISGGDGADTITGGGGADLIYLGNVTPAFGDSAVDRLVYSAVSDGGDTVFQFASATAGQRDQVALSGALNTALNDGGLLSLLGINWASGNNAAGTGVAANLTDPAGLLGQNRVEAMYLSGINASEGVTNANLTNAAAVAAAFDAEFAITSVAGNDALLVINDNNGHGFSVWMYDEAGGAEIQAGELTLMGKFHSDGTVLTSQFILI